MFRHGSYFTAGVQKTKKENIQRLSYLRIDKIIVLVLICWSLRLWNGFEGLKKLKSHPETLHRGNWEKISTTKPNSAPQGGMRSAGGQQVVHKAKWSISQSNCILLVMQSASSSNLTFTWDSSHARWLWHHSKLNYWYELKGNSLTIDCLAWNKISWSKRWQTSRIPDGPNLLTDNKHK